MRNLVTIITVVLFSASTFGNNVVSNTVGVSNRLPLVQSKDCSCDSIIMVDTVQVNPEVLRILKEDIAFLDSVNLILDEITNQKRRAYFLLDSFTDIREYHRNFLLDSLILVTTIPLNHRLQFEYSVRQIDAAKSQVALLQMALGLVDEAEDIMKDECSLRIAEARIFYKGIVPKEVLDTRSYCPNAVVFKNGHPLFTLKYYRPTERIR